MRVWISDSVNEITTVLDIESDVPEPKIVRVSGDLPDGLALCDLSRLGIVTYEVGSRGRPVPRVQVVEPAENLDYVRALVEAMPPGYHVCRVESEKLDELRAEQESRFRAEMERLAEEADQQAR